MSVIDDLKQLQVNVKAIREAVKKVYVKNDSLNSFEIDKLTSGEFEVMNIQAVRDGLNRIVGELDEVERAYITQIKNIDESSDTISAQYEKKETSSYKYTVANLIAMEKELKTIIAEETDLTKIIEDSQKEITDAEKQIDLIEEREKELSDRTDKVINRPKTDKNKDELTSLVTAVLKEFKSRG
ncbi:MAG: hypothetical protein WC783_00940 [Candidatus Paceibacterota bacterium]|jgi:hypothetical protein